MLPANGQGTRKIGRPRLLGETARRRAIQLLLPPLFGSLRPVTAQLVTEGLCPPGTAITTVSRNAHYQAKLDGDPIKYRARPPREGLTPSTLQKRLAFAEAHRHWDWGRVLFTDRARFFFRYPGQPWGHGGWESRGHPRRAVPASHPQSVSLYAALSPKGIVAMRAVTGGCTRARGNKTLAGHTARSITTGEYKRVVKVCFLPRGDKVWGKGRGSDWWLQQDNDPAHRRAGEWVQQHRAKTKSRAHLLEGWPPHSPDLNLIENVWGIVNRRVNRLGCADFDAYQKAVKKALRGVGKRVAGNLYRSMPERIKAVLEGGGQRVSLPHHASRTNA